MIKTIKLTHNKENLTRGLIGRKGGRGSSGLREPWHVHSAGGVHWYCDFGRIAMDYGIARITGGVGRRLRVSIVMHPIIIYQCVEN
jgi:hypothetical protein